MLVRKCLTYAGLAEDGFGEDCSGQELLIQFPRLGFKAISLIRLTPYLRFFAERKLFDGEVCMN